MMSRTPKKYKPRTKSATDTKGAIYQTGTAKSLNKDINDKDKDKSKK